MITITPCHNHFPYSICALATLMLSLYILLYLHFIPAMRLSILKVKLFPYWTHFGCIYLDGMFLFIVNVTWKICMWYCHAGRERVSEREGQTDGWRAHIHWMCLSCEQYTATTSIRELKDFIIWGIDTV